MSRSKFSDRFFETLDAVLSADTGDLRALAAITGVAPETLYEGADLGKSDLAAQDISWLIPLRVNVENARLTEPQKAAFKTKETQRARLQARISERERVILAFIDEYRTSRNAITTKNSGKLTADRLNRFLLDPILKYREEFEDEEMRNAYLTSILLGLKGWLSEGNISFFSSLFQLFADLKLKPSVMAIKPLGGSYLPALGPALGELLSKMEASEEIDRWFLLQAAKPDEQLRFATRLTEHRPLHPSVAVELAQDMKQLGDLITLLERAWISVDADRAEQIAYMISRRSLTRVEMEGVLQARLPKPVAQALARQFMEHPDQTRLRYLIEWRDADRGAAGGLSLETLFSAFQSFDIAVRTAESIWPNLGKGQRAVVNSVLGRLAHKKQDIARLRLLRTDQSAEISRTDRGYGTDAFGTGNYGGGNGD